MPDPLEPFVLATIGGITIAPVDDLGAAITLTTDPATYDPYVWDKRETLHPVIGGRVIRQGTGKFAADASVRIASGGQWVNKDVVQTLMAWHAIPCGTFQVIDYEGNVYLAGIRTCHPVKAAGMPDYYTLDMELTVLAFTQLLGQPYTGS